MAKRSRTTRRMAGLTAVAVTAAMAPSVLLAGPAAAVSPDLVISQVYGGGGNTGAPSTHDYVELFNRGGTAVSLGGMSIQYASATGTGNLGANSGQLTELPQVTLQPGQYLLVQQAGGTNGLPLPTPDVVDATPIAMAAGAGKVALANGTTSLGCNGGSATCSAEQLARIVDLVGYGNANFFEGPGAAPTLSNTTAALRAGGGCTDTDDNAADFTAGAPAPRNTASPGNVCGAAAEPVINEFSASTAGTDVEYIEISGSPGADYSAYTVLEIEGDAGTAAGTVDEAIPVGTTGANGRWLGGLPANSLENGTITLLLVRGFTGSPGTDLDIDGDGTLDVTPWEAVVDAVAVNDGGAGDLTYGVPVLGVAYDGRAFAPGGASRIPDGADTDTAADWVRNDFDLAGIPGFPGTPEEGEALNTPDAPNALVEVEPPPPAVALISEIQGSALTSPLLGQVRTVEAVVTAVKPGLSGFYVQEEDADVDADPATSEAIFVFGNSTVGQVQVGQLVRVTGTVGEFTSTTGAGSSQTQLANVTVEVVTTGVPLPGVTAVSFPVPSTTYLERFEGMLVELVDELVISEYFNYDRFGEVVLAKPLEGQDRLHTPTAVVEPGPAAIALAEEQARRIITLDDYFSGQNPTVVPHPGNGEPFSTTNTFRGGDTVTGVVGVIDHTFGLYRVQPTEYGDYMAVNPRPADAPDVGGSIQVASFNVLNYFLTLNQSGNRCGPLLNQDCRGANTQAELDRQRVKLVEAIAALDADVVGLMEMENTPGVEPAADLVEGLNDLMGAGTYDFIDTGVIGTDAIRLGFLYKPGTVRPAGDFAVLDTSVDPRFVDTLNRPMLTQTFDEMDTGARVTVSVNHLKSKGSACTGDPDTGDGQGNCNLTRTAAAEAIADFLATDPTRSGDPDHLVIGDLNSYDHEDPIRALEAAGYTDLVKLFGGEFAYGYVFDGRVGYLDHALSNGSLTPQVTGAAEWHLNADEPDILDYNLDFGRPATFFTPDPYRSSDHDAVLVGLDLDPATPDRCYTDGSQSVDSYAPGERKNGTPVPPGHRDATQALGRSDPGGDDPYWVTLGLGGDIVLEFARPVQNTNGTAADLRVVDAADGAKGRSDAALVYGSWDGETWVELGRVTGTGTVDMGDLPALRYVQVVDDTTGSLLEATDGYDLDAVEVLTGCV